MKVFNMLKNQHNIEFKGGIDASLVTDDIAYELSKLKIKSLFLAYDMPSDHNHLKKAVNILSKYFSRKKLRCYVLCNFFDNDTPFKAEERLKFVYNLGLRPFMMLYAHDVTIDNAKYIPYWNLLHRNWTRPAIYEYIMKKKNENINA
jgi:hypothetical protein